MNETLTIRNFGPIKDMSFEFKKINILIGDQGTGKSTVAKLVSAIKNAKNLKLFDLPENETEQFFGHLDLMGIKSYLQKNTFILYESDNYIAKFEANKISINRTSSFHEIMFFNFNYIPAERNMVHVLADSLYALIDVKAALPKLFLRFGNKYQTARKDKNEFNFNKILGIVFTHKNNGDYVLLPNGNEIYLSDASSGIQGCVALLIVVDSVTTEHLPSGTRELKKNNLGLLVIEEPELNCFPETQNKIIKYIVDRNTISWIDNNSKNSVLEKTPLKNQLIVTTHSPYILTSLNNLMYAFSVGKLHYDEVSKVIEKKYWVNPDDVSAYMLLPNGKCEGVLDSEGLIKAEKIDSVSAILNKDFNAIMDIELNIKK